MTLLYDNLEDAKTKLQGTFCMYDGKAAIVRAVDLVDDLPANERKYRIHGSYGFNGRAFHCTLDDPKFNYRDFNLGYAVREDGLGAVWYYRRPIRQYQQGLNSKQVHYKTSRRELANVNFQHTKAISLMLENKYPTCEEVADSLRSGLEVIRAFHKDFAATHDPIHGDLILEYKGEQIGHTTGKNAFKLMDRYTHLREPLMEAIAR